MCTLRYESVPKDTLNFYLLVMDEFLPDLDETKTEGVGEDIVAEVCILGLDHRSV